MALNPKNDEAAKLIAERVKVSLDYMDKNVYPKWKEAFRNYKCLSAPIYKLDGNGKETSVEDKTRTNVCMPTLNLITRRNVARMTAQPPTIGYRCTNQEVAQKLTAWSYMQYDRSGQAKQHRRIVHTGELLGVGYGKLYWDTVELYRTFRKQLPTEAGGSGFNDRAKIMRSVGTPDEEIQKAQDDAVSAYGSEFKDKMHQSEIDAFSAQQNSTEISLDERIRKYEGPIFQNVFPGDFFLPPGIACLDDADWTVEQYKGNELWLEKKAKLKYKDPETGEDKMAFDPEICDELLAMNPGPADNAQTDDLRKQFRASIGFDDPKYDKRISGKKTFDVQEQHEMRKDGMWISWSNPKLGKILGEMPYPHDLYGKFYYTEYVPMPDLISHIGDSTPILLRHLHALDNANEGQATDLVNKLVRFTAIVEKDADIPDESIQRMGGDYIASKSLRADQFLPAPQVPPGVYERAANIMRRMSMAEPAIQNVEAGTQFNPQAGKTATTAMLNAKAADVLTQDKIANLGLFLKDVYTKILWMLQAETQSPIEVPMRYVKDKALSERYGEVACITVDPYEIQEDIEVEPVVGSMLSVDDELNKQSAQEFYMAAASNPQVYDVRYAAQKYAETIRGIDSTKALIPPPDPSAQPPETKVNVSVSVKWTELHPDVQMQLLASGGLQITPEMAQDMAAAEKIKAVTQLSEGADAATNLTSEAHPPQEVNPKKPGVPNG